MAGGARKERRRAAGAAGKAAVAGEWRAAKIQARQGRFPA